ncbi:hypothetical protein JCM3775_005721 [Rhodotorula graminis]
MALVGSATGSESVLLAIHWVHGPLVAADIHHFGIGGLAALAYAAQGAINQRRDVELIARHLVNVSIPTRLAPITVRVHAADHERTVNRLDHRAFQDRLIVDATLHGPFQTHAFQLSTAHIRADQPIECHVKVVVVPEAVEPDPHGDGWLGCNAVIVEQLALASTVEVDSDGHHTAFMLIRWAFLLDVLVLRSNVQEQRAEAIPEEQHGAIIDRHLLLSVQNSVDRWLVGRHGLEIIDAILPRLTAHHARSAAAWESTHYNHQYHRFDPVTPEGRRREITGQYEEIMSALKTLLERTELAAQHSLAKSVYHPERRSGPSSSNVLL